MVFQEIDFGFLKNTLNKVQINQPKRQNWQVGFEVMLTRSLLQTERIESQA